MIKIAKSPEPDVLTKWKRKHPKLNRYAHLNDKTATAAIKAEGAVVIDAIRTYNVIDQHYLCAYCCAEIRDHKTSAMNEHLEARDLNHRRELDFTNIVASCTTKGQCDDAHDHQPLPLTPLMAECETELKFRLTGKVEGLTDRAKQAIQVLNLGDEHRNNRALINRRKQALDAFLREEGIDAPMDLAEFKDHFADIMRPSQGKLAPFAPVLANILRGMEVC